MTKGTINLRKMDLMGFTAETQVYFVENGGGKGSVNTFHFLTKISKWMDKQLFCGQHYNSITAPRVAKFKAYCESQGYEVKC